MCTASKTLSLICHKQNKEQKTHSCKMSRHCSCCCKTLFDDPCRSYVGGTQLRILKRILRSINFSAAAKEDAIAKKAASSVQKTTKLATKLLTLNACRGLQPMSCRVLWSMGRVYRWVCILLSPFCPSSSSHSSSSTKIYKSFFSSPIVCSDVLSENSFNTRSTKTVITASIQNHDKHN